MLMPLITNPFHLIIEAILDWPADRVWSFCSSCRKLHSWVGSGLWWARWIVCTSTGVAAVVAPCLAGCWCTLTCKKISILSRFSISVCVGPSWRGVCDWVSWLRFICVRLFNKVRSIILDNFCREFANVSR